MLDITQRKEAEEQIAFLAYHDKLTGLPNRIMFDELLGLALARARRHGLGVAVVSVDIDNFKLVNDSLGHEAGRRLLLQLAERLREATRETDLVARPGVTSSSCCSPTSNGRPRHPESATASAIDRRVGGLAGAGSRCASRSRSPAPSST